jgi:hypothetical protein
MKLDDLDRAKKMGEELKELERKYGYFQNVHAIEVSGRDGSYRIELGDYPEPSELGRGVRRGSESRGALLLRSDHLEAR